MSFSGGWDSAATLVDGRWVDRRPRRPEVADQLRRETRLMPWLAPRLPVPVPVPRVVNSDPLVVRHEYLPGEPIDKLEATHGHQLECGVPGLRGIHGPAGDGRRSYEPGSVTRGGFLVLAKRHGPHRPHQPRCAPRWRPRPRRPQQLSPRDRSGPGPPSRCSRVDPAGTVHEAARTTRKRAERLPMSESNQYRRRLPSRIRGLPTPGRQDEGLLRGRSGPASRTHSGVCRQSWNPCSLPDQSNSVIAAGADHSGSTNTAVP